MELTKNKLAELFGIDARTMGSRLAELDINPVDKNAAFKKYKVSDVYKATHNNVVSESEKGAYVVEELAPKDRKDHFASEKGRLEVEKMKRELIEFKEAMDGYSDLAMDFSNFFGTLIDNLELKGVSPEAIEYLEKQIDQQRDIFANREFIEIDIQNS